MKNNSMGGNDMIQGNKKYPIKGTDIQLKRIGFGAMRLSGTGIWGPPKDEHEAIAVLRTAVDLGVNHIDTADFYGPHITNQIIRKALFFVKIYRLLHLYFHPSLSSG